MINEKPEYTPGDELGYAKRVAEWNNRVNPKDKSKGKITLDGTIHTVEKLNKKIEDIENSESFDGASSNISTLKQMRDNILSVAVSKAKELSADVHLKTKSRKAPTLAEKQAQHDEYVKVRKYQKAQEIKHAQHMLVAGKDIPETDEYGTELIPEETEEMNNHIRQITADMEAIDEIPNYAKAPKSTDVTDVLEYMLDVKKQFKEDLPKIRKTAADIVEYMRTAMGKEIVQMMSQRDFNTLINRLETATSVGSLKRAIRDVNNVIQNIVVRKNNNVIKDLLSGKVLNTYLTHQLSEKAEQNGKSADEDYRKLMQGINTYNTYFQIQQKDKRGVQIYKNVDERTRTLIQFIRNNVKQENGEFIVTAKDKLNEIEEQAREKVEALQARLALRKLTEAQKKEVLQQISDEDWKFTAIKMLEMLDQLLDKQADIRDIQNTDAEEFKTEYKYEAVFRARRELEKIQTDIIRDFGDMFNNGRGRLADWQQAQENRWSDQITEALQAVHDKEVKSQAEEKKKENTTERMRRILGTNPIKKWYYAPQASFEFMLKWIDRNNPIGKGKFYHRWMSSEDGVIVAEEKLYKGSNAYKAGLQSKIKEIFGEEYTLEQFAKDTDTDSGTTITYTETKDGEQVIHRDVPMTKGELMYVWLTWQHLNGREKLEGMWNSKYPQTVEVVQAVNNVSNITEAKAIAAEFGGKEYVNTHTGEAIKVSKTATDKTFSESAYKKSDDMQAHLSAISVLPEILENSLLGEEHPDRNNDPNIEGIQRFYGALRYNGETYRVKTTVKKIKNEGNKHYTYEIQEIELLPARSINEKKDDAKAAHQSNTDNNSILTANLLKDVESNYEEGKNFQKI